LPDLNFSCYTELPNLEVTIDTRCGFATILSRVSVFNNKIATSPFEISENDYD